jgi:hypothetical protein
MKETNLGQLFGLRLSFVPSALIGFMSVWAVLSIGTEFFLRTSLWFALGLGLAAAIFHWLSELVHQFGHAWAARRTGHPMTGIRFWGMLSSSVYPADEAQLPGRTHIQRALGGPAASVLLTLLVGILTLALTIHSLAWWLTLFVFLDNLFVFTLQVFLPLGFNDGGTLYHWLKPKS